MGVRRGPLIVISGSPGSGKSTYAIRLSRDLGLTYYSTGSIFRAMAAELGIDLLELNKRAEGSAEIDYMIEKKTIELAEEGNVVIDSHLAAWILAGRADLLIYVKASLPERARRVARRDSLSYIDAMEEIVAREYSHWRRFATRYGIDIRDLSIFHLVVDTEAYGVEETYEIIKAAAKMRIGKLIGGYYTGRGEKRDASDRDRQGVHKD